jgi:succinate dehydrogenase/fumarate reductase-like Fe-S protein
MALQDTAGRHIPGRQERSSGATLICLCVPDAARRDNRHALGTSRSEIDPSLAFRFSCINANACKECMMLIDGKVGYACTVRLKEGVTNLAPLPKKTLIRDIVTEIAPPDERL